MDDSSIHKFQKGSKETFRQLFDLLYPSLCLFANKFLKDQDEAEDITQEALITLWQERTKFESFIQVKNFLYLTVKNRCLNSIKHREVVQNYSRSVNKDEITVDEYILETEVANNLTRAINQLPEQQKKVILLNLQGLKNEEIAGEMDISLNTVKLYKKNAYKSLRAKMKNPGLISLLM